MRIDHVKLINFRAFESFELDLDPQLTVLAGRNGCGKSTILDGLSVALGAWVASFQSIREDAPLHRSWARLVRGTGDVPVVEARFPIRVEARGELAGQKVDWARELRRVDGRTTSASPRTFAASRGRSRTD